MKNSPKWLFIAACVLALAAIVQNFRFDAATHANQAAARGVEADVAALRLSLAELRAGQTAYLATGQGPDFWVRRVSELAAQMEAGIAKLSSSARTSEARAQMSSAAKGLADLVAIDARARQALDGSQRFLASDIVFTESLPATQAIADGLANAAAAETAVLEGLVTRDSRLQLAMMTAALVLTVFAGLLWAQTTPAGSSSPAGGVAQMLRDLPPPVRSPVAQTASVPAARPVPAAPAALAIDLAGAAELCVDLARAMDSSDIPALLSRAAQTLEASGLVIWVVTTDGQSLVPGLTHGYSNKVVSRLGSLPVSADNLTSTCFRSMRPQTMAGVGQPGATSAVAVPLITAAGCLGVLSAELRVIKPPAENLAVARIIAAQFATMITPAETAAVAEPLPEPLRSDDTARVAEA